MARGKLAYLGLYVNSSVAYTQFEAVADDEVEAFSERLLDAFGQQIGKDGAKKLATDQIDQWKAAGKEAELVTRVIPQITLYATTNRGVVQAINAETGRTLWAQKVGNTNYPTLEPAANDSVVAVVNGSTLYILGADDGKELWNRRIKGVPGAGAGAFSNDGIRSHDYRNDGSLSCR